MTRREFVGTAAKATAGLVGGSALATAPPAQAAAAAPPAKDILNYQPSMNYRKLGKTDLWISEISLGGHWRTREGARYWGSFPNDQVPADVMRNREEVVGRAIDLGINYMDITTPAEATAYGNAMKALGQRMYVGYSDYILCIRNPANRTKEKIMFEIDEGLRRFQLDCIDIFRPQALMDGNHTDQEIDAVVETGMLAMEQGKIRHLGLSTHNREFVMRLMEGWPEFEMFIFPFMAESKVDNEHSVFPMLREKNCGLVTIKPFAGGSLFRDAIRKQGPDVDKYEVASISLRKILSNEYLTATVPGMTTIDELENNVSIWKQPKQLTEAEQRLLTREFRHAMANLPPDYQWLREWEYV
ncbi:MAG: aldo/keto reductase [Armatimonadota bacterium]